MHRLRLRRFFAAALLHARPVDTSTKSKCQSSRQTQTVGIHPGMMNKALILSSADFRYECLNFLPSRSDIYSQLNGVLV
ncbi:hypothetical protein C8R47DRAFT_263564 [Mycena vitilis]|nr:hypothetical protein C8R47DRAFT_263564 [Mycena vitilis]